MESVLALSLSSVAVTHASPVEAFDFVELAIRTYYDSGTLVFVPGAIGVLGALLGRFERYEAAATISAFAEVPSHVVIPRNRHHPRESARSARR